MTALWDRGATFNIIKTQVAEEAGWQKWPTEQKFVLARGDVKGVKMHIYKVPLITS